MFFCEFKVKAALAVKSSYKYEALSLWLPDGNDDEDNNGSFLLILGVRDLHKTVPSFVLSTINCRFPTMKIKKSDPLTSFLNLSVLLITKLAHIFPILCGFKVFFPEKVQ